MPVLRRALALGLVALAAVITSSKILRGQALARPPASWEAAVAAWRLGDEHETARLAQQAGRPAILAGLAARDRGEVAAALVALARHGAPWPLPELATLAASPDRRRALAALQVARALVARLAAGPEGAAAEGLDGVELAVARDRWLAVAGERARWADVRADSLEVAAALGQAAWQAGEPAALGDTEQALRSFFEDPDPALRRAAIELMPVPLSTASAAALATQLHSEREPAVAAVAAAALCAELAAPQADPAPVLTQLGAGGLAQVQAWTRASAQPGATEVALARCLAAAGDEPSAQALRHLRAVASGPVRRALAAVQAR